jgi:hypothetical protein
VSNASGEIVERKKSDSTMSVVAMPLAPKCGRPGRSRRLLKCNQGRPAGEDSREFVYGRAAGLVPRADAHIAIVRRSPTASSLAARPVQYRFRTAPAGWILAFSQFKQVMVLPASFFDYGSIGIG